MFGSEARVKRLFANRFEPEGDSFLFRANLRAPAIRVSARERSDFVVKFNRNIQISSWAWVALTLLMLVGAVVVSHASSTELPDFAMYLLLAFCLAGLLMGILWLWNEPVRALRGRVPETPGRSQAEAKQLGFQRLTWKQLGLAAATVPVMLLRIGARQDLFVGWNRVWLIFAGLLVVLIAVQAVRKLRSPPGRPRIRSDVR